MKQYFGLLMRTLDEQTPVASSVVRNRVTMAYIRFEFARSFLLHCKSVFKKMNLKKMYVVLVLAPGVKTLNTSV